MRIAIIDDNEKDANSLRDAAQLWADKNGIPASIDIFPSAEAFSFRFIENRDVDLLLLDVEMEGEDGIALAKRLREEGCGAEIVFVTSHFELAGEGYDVDALHYLVKPVRDGKLFEVLTKAHERMSAEPPSVVISCGGQTIRLKEKDILYIEALLHYLVIHTAAEEYKIKEPLGVFSGRLSEDFFRVHRSVIVNLRHIVRITRSEVTLDSGDILPLARGKYDAVNQAFIGRM